MEMGDISFALHKKTGAARVACGNSCRPRREKKRKGPGPETRTFLRV